MSVILYYVLWSILTLLRHKVHTKMKDIWCNCESKERLLPISDKSLFDTRWHQFCDSRWHQFFNSRWRQFFDSRWHHFFLKMASVFFGRSRSGQKLLILINLSKSTKPLSERENERKIEVCLFDLLEVRLMNLLWANITLEFCYF